MISRGTGDGEAEMPKKENIREQINKLQQKLRDETANYTDKRCISAHFEDRGLQSDAELLGRGFRDRLFDCMRIIHFRPLRFLRSPPAATNSPARTFRTSSRCKRESSANTDSPREVSDTITTRRSFSS